MDLNSSQNLHNKLKFIKILLAVMCALITPYASGIVLITLLSTAVFAYILFGETVLNKVKLCAVYMCVFTALSIYLKTELIVFLIKIINILLPSAVLSSMYNKKITDLAELVKGVTVANLIVSLLDLAKLKFYDKIDIIKDNINPYFDSMRPLYTEILNQNKEFIPKEAFVALDSVFNLMQEFTIRFIPLILIASSAITAFVVIKISAYLIGKSLKVNHYTIASPFEEYTTPHHSGILLIALFIAVLSGKNNSFTSACYNLLAFIFAEYVVCGTAIVLYMAKKITKANGILKYLVFALCIFLICVVSAILSFIGGLNILVLLGMFDANFNFRKLKKLKKPRFLK